ncbi:hypothetical protein HDU77_002412 [Chytriomyces hyalinus]|nr:hypothetical protein HDU77_002412 [Chytriomyces hyalinus]
MQFQHGNYFNALASHGVAGTAALLDLGLGLMDTPRPSITPPPRPLSAPSALFPPHLRGREPQPGSPLTATACTLDQSKGSTHAASKSHQSVVASRLKRSISTGSESSAKRVPSDAAADSQSSLSTTQRVLSHKKSDQRRREALRSSFNRLQSVIPQQSPTASPASSGVPGSAVPASSTSPPPLLNDDNDDDEDGGKGLNRVETMQATIRYIHSLRDKNLAMDGKIAALQAELLKLKQRQQILPS